MRPSLLLIVFLSSQTLLSQQGDIWEHVNTEPSARPRTVTPSPQQLAILKKALKERELLDVEDCADEEPNWVEKVFFRELPISETEKALLIEAGQGCARGGQGSNGAMWVLRMKGDKVSFLATPEQKFWGWPYSIQPTTGHGLRDLVLGWHMSAAETDLNYFRFDGTSYHLLGTAVLVYGEDGTRKIVPGREAKLSRVAAATCLIHALPGEQAIGHTASAVQVGF
jgi:hypothetical protein